MKLSMYPAGGGGAVFFQPISSAELGVDVIRSTLLWRREVNGKNETSLIIAGSGAGVWELISLPLPLDPARRYYLRSAVLPQLPPCAALTPCLSTGGIARIGETLFLALVQKAGMIMARYHSSHPQAALQTLLPPPLPPRSPPHPPPSPPPAPPFTPPERRPSILAPSAPTTPSTHPPLTPTTATTPVNPTWPSGLVFPYLLTLTPGPHSYASHPPSAQVCPPHPTPEPYSLTQPPVVFLGWTCKSGMTLATRPSCCTRQWMGSSRSSPTDYRLPYHA